jgi:hypothetical protein
MAFFFEKLLITTARWREKLLITTARWRFEET